ncbi:VOC family protein [Labrys okinawensis]|uniref:VOC family protein n=1 Tax=Labrys okinawensis TaxID=346911 RepID=UPI0039BD3B10
MKDWKPANYNSVSPYLVCRDAERVIAFLTAAFKAELLRRFDRPDGSLMHAELRIDDSIVMLGGGARMEPSEGMHIHVYVRDVEAVYERALKAGGTSVQEPVRKRADDDRRAGVSDGCGNIWWIATQ